jgi:PhnB protein
MQIDPHLGFSGNCEEAFTFYEKTFGGKIEFKMTYGESPMAAQFEPESRNKIMHISMRVGDRILMGADAPPQHQEKPQGFCVCVAVKDAAEAEKVFNALAEGGKVTMPLAETFWSSRFGMLTDRFGIPWMVNTNTTQTA